jgi:yeast amino acid transporter
MIFGYKFIMKTKTVQPHTADLYGGKARTDAEAEFIAAEAAKKGEPETKGQKIYRVTLGWAF